MAGWTVVPNPDTSTWKPVAQPSAATPEVAPPSGGIMGGLKSFADATGLRPLAHAIVHPIQAQQEESQAWSEHPMQKLGESLLGPVAPMIQGAAQGAKRIGGELSQARDSALEGNSAGGISHAISAIPFIGPGLDRASDESGPTDSHRDSYGKQLGATLGSSRAMGTLAGTAATVAPMILGGIDSAAPNRSQFAPIAAPLRDAAIGDTDAAALRGLQVGPRSPKTLSTLKSVAGARPYLEGAQSLEDLQSKIPAAKAEIWQPYQQAVDAIGERPVKGPDGMTTVRDLESQRAQLSALNRGLKQQLPEAIQVAQQKGMTQAELLAQERSVQAALDPELASTGIDPKGIRRTFGNVSQVGQRISGKSTLIEPTQPSGLGKIGQFSLEKPLQAPGQVLGGLRDLIAGRPMFEAKPTDIGIREGFAKGGPKPNLGQFQMPQAPTRGLLESDVPGNANYGEDYSKGGFPSRPGFVTPAPPTLRALPATASPFASSEGLPVGNLHPGTPGPGAATRVSPTEFNAHPDVPAPRGFRVAPDGSIKPEPYILSAPRALKSLLSANPELSDLPLSSHSDIFQDQLPGTKRVKK